MNTVEATFAVPSWIEKGLESQAYERVGGVIPFCVIVAT
jgi:hypothetical protein